MARRRPPSAAVEAFQDDNCDLMRHSRSTLRLADRHGTPHPLVPAVDVRETADVTRGRGTAREGYQAWLVPQWGQPTEVVTSALKLYPHWHRYRA